MNSVKYYTVVQENLVGQVTNVHVFEALTESEFEEILNSITFVRNIYTDSSYENQLITLDSIKIK